MAEFIDNIVLLHGNLVFILYVLAVAFVFCEKRILNRGVFAILSFIALGSCAALLVLNGATLQEILVELTLYAVIALAVPVKNKTKDKDAKND